MCRSKTRRCRCVSESPPTRRLCCQRPRRGTCGRSGASGNRARPCCRRGLLAAALAPGCIARRARGPPGDWKGHGGEQCDRSGIAERDSGMSGGRGRGARLALPRQGREPRPGAGQVRRVRPETLCHLHGARSAPLRCLHPSPLSLSRLRRPSRRSGTVDRDASRLLLLPLRGSS